MHAPSSTGGLVGSDSQACGDQPLKEKNTWSPAQLSAAGNIQSWLLKTVLYTSMVYAYTIIHHGYSHSGIELSQFSFSFILCILTILVSCIGDNTWKENRSAQRSNEELHCEERCILQYMCGPSSTIKVVLQAGTVKHVEANHLHQLEPYTFIYSD